MKVHGVVRVPGDKSISHRALFLAAVARGTSRLTRPAHRRGRAAARPGLLRQLGAVTCRSAADQGARSWFGQRASQPHATCSTVATRGRRPVSDSVCSPGQGLRAASDGRCVAAAPADGAAWWSHCARWERRFANGRGGRLPLTVRGGALHGITYASPVASAQVKSALLLAALAGQVPVTLTEPWRSRDHTERLFVHLGLDLHETNGAISYQPSAAALSGFDLTIPGDISSAAFLSPRRSWPRVASCSSSASA